MSSFIISEERAILEQEMLLQGENLPDKSYEMVELYVFEDKKTEEKRYICEDCIWNQDILETDDNGEVINYKCKNNEQFVETIVEEQCLCEICEGEK